MTAADFVPAGADLEGLRTAARGCRGCELWEPATQTVFSAGPADATVVLVGEQPGDQEDRQGLPFVGPAGRLLVKALDDAGLPRETVYRTNAVTLSFFGMQDCAHDQARHDTDPSPHLHASEPGPDWRGPVDRAAGSGLPRTG
jgi:DNA polymerase